MILEPSCTHHPLTTKHLSISWCSRCQQFSVRSSQSGRRDTSGGIVLIEVLQVGMIPESQHTPDALLWFLQQFFASVVELEMDRIDTDALR